MSLKTKTVLYTVLAAALSAGLTALPPAYAALGASLLGAALYNLRAVWHLPEPEAQQ
jgi:hypothetical protein